MKLFVPLLSCVLVSQNKVVAQSGAPCSVCGEGLEVTIPDGVVTIPQNGDFVCSDLEAFGQQGGFDASTCTVLESFVASPCGCAAIQGDGNSTSVNGTSVPTVSPTIAPTFGPAPDCFDNLDAVQQRERALSAEDIQVGRTYILCPDTVFFMGSMNPSTGQFENDGFAPITPRPNVLYKCGESGSSANGCRLLGGTFAIFSFGGDAVQTNVTFQGLTIESNQGSGVLAANAGDYTFLDCIFKNHESSGPVNILFNNQGGRRLSHLKEMLHGDVHAYSESHFVNSVGNAREGDRHLQGSTAVTTLTMTFKQTIFEGNKLISEQANSGMVTSVTPETILNFEDVTFQNNDYGDPTLQIPGAAILSRGPLTVKNSCFLSNSFVGNGAVIFLGTEGLDVNNNYISPVDDQLKCSFIASYPDESAWMAGTDLVCTNADATSCEADIPPVSAPSISPEDQPTRIPVPRLTLPPASSPTTPPSSAHASLSMTQICVTIIVAFGMVFLLH